MSESSFFISSIRLSPHVIQINEETRPCGLANDNCWYSHSGGLHSVGSQSIPTQTMGCNNNPGFISNRTAISTSVERLHTPWSRHLAKNKKNKKKKIKQQQQHKKLEQLKVSCIDSIISRFMSCLHCMQCNGGMTWWPFFYWNQSSFFRNPSGIFPCCLGKVGKLLSLSDCSHLWEARQMKGGANEEKPVDCKSEKERILALVWYSNATPCVRAGEEESAAAKH